MKALLCLVASLAISTVNTVCNAQFLSTDAIIQLQRAEYAERLSKAEKAGISLFGAEGQTKLVVLPQMNGTIAAKTPLEFEVGDWGCTSEIFIVLHVVSPTEILVVPVSGGAKSELMLIRGMNTANVTDGVEFVIPHPFAISGTYEYKVVQVW